MLNSAALSTVSENRLFFPKHTTEQPKFLLILWESLFVEKNPSLSIVRFYISGQKSCGVYQVLNLGKYNLR